MRNHRREIESAPLPAANTLDLRRPAEAATGSQRRWWLHWRRPVWRQQSRSEGGRTTPLLSRRAWLAAGGAATLLAGAGVAGWWWLWPAPIALPAAVAAKVLFPTYLPTALPGGYHIDPASYDTSRSVLLFHAADHAGHTIVFSEQAKPQNYNIGNFQQQSLNNSYSLPSAPYPSVIGKTDQGPTLLSVVTDETWLIITSTAPNATNNLSFIAQRLRH